MAKVVITIQDDPKNEGGILARLESDPPIDTSNMDAATDAQLLALGFIAEAVQSAAEIYQFSANGEEHDL